MTLTIEDTQYRNEVLKMARQVGKNLETSDEGYRLWTYEALEAFAKLVADVATAKEREACAKVCEGFSKTHGLHTKHCVAAAIRARGGEAT